EDLVERMADPQLAEQLAHLVAASSFATDQLVADPGLVFGLSGSVTSERAATAALIGVMGHYAARDIGPEKVGDALARIADNLIQDAVQAAAPGVPFAVIGLGKLGAEELNFASDLDVVFVYEGEGPEDFAESARAAEEVIATIRAAGWEPDPDLRPEGRSGPI